MSNTFRKSYRTLDALQQEHIEQIKDAATRLEMLIDQNSPSAEQSRQIRLAMTNLEQAVFWAVKAYT